MAVNGSARKGGAVQVDDSDRDDLDDVDQRPPSRRNSTPKRRRRRRRWPLLIVGVAAGGIAVTAIAFGSSKPSYYTYVNQKAGFSLSYPSSWTLDHSSDPNVGLLLSFGGGGLDVFQVRVDPVQASVDTSNVANLKAVTDAIISGTRVDVLEQDPVSLAGLPGYYYRYSLPPYKGTTIMKSQFFIFPPHEMVTMQFQTLEQDFSGKTSQFDHVLNSFRTTS